MFFASDVHVYIQLIKTLENVELMLLKEKKALD